MFGFRFSLLQLAIAMVIVCLGCAAIVAASALIASITLTVFFVANLVAVTGSFTTIGQARAFWIGMAFFGWGYWWQHEPTLLMENNAERYRYGYGGWGYSWPYYGGISGTGGERSGKSPRLSSEWILDKLYQMTERAPKVGEKVIAKYMGSAFYPGVVESIGDDDVYMVKWEDGTPATPVPAKDVHNEGDCFYITGHAVFGVFFGLFGGILGLAFFGLKQEEPAATSPAAVPPPATTPPLP